MACRACGCTPDEPCELAHRWPHGRPYADPARRAESVQGVRRTCRMVGDVCTRCHGTTRNGRLVITSHQADELARITRRYGPPARSPGGDRVGVRVLGTTLTYGLLVQIHDRPATEIPPDA